MVQLDSYTPRQKQEYLVAGCTLGLLFSVASTGLRFWSKTLTAKGLQWEDWSMLVGLVLSFGQVICLFYSLTVGLGQHVENVSAPDLVKFRLTIWIIQRFQAPTLFFIKTSILLFYARLFPTPRFRIVAWIVWGYTAAWTVGTTLATLLECLPVSYYWDKDQAGKCIPNALITIGLPNGVTSCLGDIVIFAMPFPLLGRLNVNRRQKWGLIVIFAVGFFVVCISVIRWIALLGTADDITYTQVEAGLWTYLEAAMGITCGNFPVLGGLFRRWLGLHEKSKASGRPGSTTTHSNPLRTIGSAAARSKHKPDAYERVDDSGSEVELRDRAREMGADRIVVETEVDIDHIAERWSPIPAEGRDDLGDVRQGEQFSSVQAASDRQR